MIINSISNQQTTYSAGSHRKKQAAFGTHIIITPEIYRKLSPEKITEVGLTCQGLTRDKFGKHYGLILKQGNGGENCLAIKRKVPDDPNYKDTMNDTVKSMQEFLQDPIAFIKKAAETYAPKRSKELLTLEQRKAAREFPDHFA